MKAVLKFKPTHYNKVKNFLECLHSSAFSGQIRVTSFDSLPLGLYFPTAKHQQSSVSD